MSHDQHLKRVHAKSLFLGFYDAGVRTAQGAIEQSVKLLNITRPAHSSRNTHTPTSARPHCDAFAIGEMRRRGREIDRASFGAVLVASLALLATARASDEATIATEHPKSRAIPTRVSGASTSASADPNGAVTVLKASNARFPASFAFGVATSAWQIEGAGGKRPESTWDAFAAATLGRDAAAEMRRGIEFYERYEDDVKMMSEAGVKNFKMSLSWPRLMRADGTKREEGFKFYERVLGALRKSGIEPHITLFHWDTPIWLCVANRTRSSNGVCEGAWARDEVIEAFETYADAVFERLGKGVKYWTTISEPKTICELGYGAGMHAPGRRGVEEQLKVGHNMLLAHARAVALYRKKYADLGGKLSLNLNSAWAEPASDSMNDATAAANAMDEELGWFADPVFTGDYPRSMRSRLGYFLPQFTEEQKAQIKGSVDFFALNHYTSYYVKHVPAPVAASQLGIGGKPQPWEITLFAESSKEPIGKEAQSNWLRVVPWGLEKILLHIKEKYDDPEIIITENGVDIAEKGDIAETLDDSERVQFIDAYLGAARSAMRKGAKVIGYFYWSMFDNIEWVDGASKRFGLVYIDYSGKYGQKMKRYPKKSLEHYSAYMRGEHAEEPEEPEPALGVARENNAMDDMIASFGKRSDGEALAMRGLGVTFACVFIAATLAKRVRIDIDDTPNEHSGLV